MSGKINVIFLFGEKPETFELHADNLKDVLSLLKLQKGEEFTNFILENKFKFVLADSKSEDNFIALLPEVIFSSFEGYDVLFVVPEVSGNDPVSLGMLAMAAFTAVSGVAIAGAPIWVAGLIGSVMLAGVSIGLNMLMSALSPTPEFSSDPAATQNTSNLFNGAPIIRNQGGSVPLLFGFPYCGAVLISSGISSEEVSV
jgi:predicted phage tail protein